MHGSGNLDVHPLRRTELGGICSSLGMATGIRGHIASTVIIAMAFAQVRRILKRGSAPDS